MSDWEKRRPVLDAVVTCREMLNPPGYRMTDCSVACPYYEKRAEKQCVKVMLEDMEALIRGLEPVKPIIKSRRGSVLFHDDCIISIAFCGNCNEPIDMPCIKHDKQPKYCRCCGREIDWDAEARR